MERNDIFDGTGTQGPAETSAEDLVAQIIAEETAARGDAETPATTSEPSSASEQEGDEDAPAHEPARIDIGEALKRTAILLDAIEQSGNDLNAITDANVDEDEFDKIVATAREREQWNPSVFAGEEQAFTTFHLVEDEEIRAEAHKQVMFYWRRAKTSSKVATALFATYRSAVVSALEQDEPVDNGDYKKKLSEILGVVTALSEEHDQIVSLAQDAQAGDHERANARYHEQVDPLVEAFDECLAQYSKASKIRFKKRKAALAGMRDALSRIDEANKVFEHYDFIEFVTRELPED